MDKRELRILRNRAAAERSRQNKEALIASLTAQKHILESSIRSLVADYDFSSYLCEKITNHCLQQPFEPAVF